MATEDGQLRDAGVERLCEALWDHLLVLHLRHFRLTVDECLDPDTRAHTRSEPARTLVLQFIADRVCPLWPRLCAMAGQGGWLEERVSELALPAASATPRPVDRGPGPGAYLYRVSLNYFQSIRRKCSPLSARAYDHTRELMLSYLARPGAWRTEGARLRLDAQGRPMPRLQLGGYQADISIDDTYLSLVRAQSPMAVVHFDLGESLSCLGPLWSETSSDLSKGPRVATAALVQLLDALPSLDLPLPTRLDFSTIQAFLLSRYEQMPPQPRVVEVTGAEVARPRPAAPDLRSQILLCFHPVQHLSILAALDMKRIIGERCLGARAGRLLDFHHWLTGTPGSPGFLAAQAEPGEPITRSLPSGSQHRAWAQDKGYDCGKTQLYGDRNLILEFWFHALDMESETESANDVAPDPQGPGDGSPAEGDV